MIEDYRMAFLILQLVSMGGRGRRSARRSEVRGQRSEVGDQRSEISSQSLEGGDNIKRRIKCK